MRPAAIVSTAESPRGSMPATSPTSSMIPVNTAAPLSLLVDRLIGPVGPRDDLDVVAEP